MMSEEIKEAAKSFSEIVKERGLAVVLCVVLIGFVLWSNYAQTERAKERTEYEREQTEQRVARESALNEKLLTVISGNTAVMQAAATSNEANTAAVEALRMEIMKSK